VEEYLSIESVAKRLELSPKSVKNKMAKGVFKLGVHYFRPPGLTPRFKWSAIVAWMESQGQQAQADSDVIPMPLHYATENLSKIMATPLDKLLVLSYR
jgi:hypothetical protein